MYGDGESSRDYTFVDDIIDGAVRAMTHNQGFEIYNHQMWRNNQNA